MAFSLWLYQNPTLDWETSPLFRAMVDVAVTTISIDSVVDRFLAIRLGVKNLKMLLAFITALLKPEIEVEEMFSKLEDEDPASSVNLLGITANSFHKSTRGLAEVETEGGNKSMDHVFAAVMETSTGPFCTLLEKASESTRFSEQGFRRNVGQHAYGMIFFLETNLLASPGPELSPEIRNSLLFKMLMDSFGNGTALINAICGIRKLEDTWRDTTILRDVVLKGLTLQESWNNAVQEFAGEVHDMNLAMALLRDNYEDEEGVEEFLQIFYDTFMGICFVYADEFAASIYLGTSVKVITLEQDSEVVLATAKDPKERKVTNIGEVAGMYFGENNAGFSSNEREVLVAVSAESLVGEE